MKETVGHTECYLEAHLAAGHRPPCHEVPLSLGTLSYSTFVCREAQASCCFTRENHVN